MGNNEEEKTGNEREYSVAELTCLIGDACEDLTGAAKKIRRAIRGTHDWKEKLDRFDAAGVDYDLDEAVRRIESGAALLHRTVGVVMYVRGGKEMFKW